MIPIRKYYVLKIQYSQELNLEMNYPAASTGVSTRKIFLTSPQAAGNTTLRDSKPFIKDHGKFYKRNSAGKYPMDVSELRIAFIQSEQIVDKIRKFRNDRVEKLKAEHELPVCSYSFILPCLCFNSE